MQAKRPDRLCCGLVSTWYQVRFLAAAVTLIESHAHCNWCSLGSCQPIEPTVYDVIVYRSPGPTLEFAYWELLSHYCK